MQSAYLEFINVLVKQEVNDGFYPAAAGPPAVELLPNQTLQRAAPLGMARGCQQVSHDVQYAHVQREESGCRAERCSVNKSSVGCFAVQLRGNGIELQVRE